MPKIDEELLIKATAKANAEIGNVFENLPKTTYGFESDVNSLKKDTSNIYKYLKKMPMDFMGTLFKSAEMNTDHIGLILKTFNQFGVQDDANHCLGFLASMAKSSNFDMQLMFMDNNEQKELKSLFHSFQNEPLIDGALLKSVKSKYGL
jgi:hypothetical protein